MSEAAASDPIAPLPDGDDELAARAVALAERFARVAAGCESRRARRRRRRLGRMVNDPDGIAFTLALTDRVLRIRDDRRAGRRLAGLVAERGIPAYLGPLDRLALAAAARLAGVVPAAVMPLVRIRARAESSGLVLPAADPGLHRHLHRRRDEGFRLNLNLLGEAILGEDEARRRVAAVRAAVARPDVQHISVKVSSVCSQLDVLAFDHSVARVVERLLPIYRDAAAADPPTFVNLDMEEYHDLALTAEVLRRVLDHDELAGLDAGIALQAYIPDSAAVLTELCEWALGRHARAGGRLRVRLVKGANLAMERVDAELNGWPAAPYEDKAQVDASYKHLLDIALDDRYAPAVRIGIGSHNLFDVAWALVLAGERGALDRVEIEMLEGMADPQADAVRRVAGSLLLYAPVVDDREFDAAIAYLARRLDENTAPGNFLRSVFDLRVGSPAWEAERARFLAAVADRHRVPTGPRRTQARSLPTRPVASDAFRNEPGTDFTLPANRSWILAHLADRQQLPVIACSRIAGHDVAAGMTEPGIDPSAPAAPAYRWVRAGLPDVERAVQAGVAAGARWAARPAAERADVLRRVAASLADQRGRLLAAMARDAGKTVREGDPEVSEAIDFARYYADAAVGLDAITTDGVTFEPYRLTVVAAPWNFPVAIPAGGVLAALAAGSAVILKPAPQAVLVARVLAECFWAAGVPDDVLQLALCADDEAGRALISDDRVDAVVLTGSYLTAELFLDWRPNLRLHAETSGKNAIVITAAADLDGAVRDLVRSAFGHAGQKCSAASVAICEAGVYDDERFLRQLADATESLVVGPAWDVRSVVGPVIEPPTGPLDRALHMLEPGERWLVEPRRLDTHGHLWSPGVKLGVQPGSWFHGTECFGPVLGLMRAPDLATAVEWQNGTPFGLTAGIHSLDPAEVAQWAASVEAGNLYVNRGTTGAIVRRQPFGGWKRSSVGPTAKAGGPNYVLTLGRWHEPEPVSSARTVSLAEAVASFRWWWSREFAAEHDPSGLRAESNVLRYRPLRRVALHVGAGAADHEAALARLAAGIAGVEVVDRLDGARPDKLRILGRAGPDVYAAAHRTGVPVDDNAAVAHGRIELLRWVHEQTVSATTHRYGNVTR